MNNFLKIYFWQIISFAFNFSTLFIVTPFLSKQPNLYGIYIIITSGYLFISYADFGFLSAGMKYSSEYFAQNNLKQEVEMIGFTTSIFLFFSLIYAIGVFLISFNPTFLIKSLTNQIEIGISRKLLLILCLSTPIIVFQRIIQIIFGIRLKDYVFQRVLIFSNLIKIISTFFFFSYGKYMIVEYFLFSQICLLFSVIFGFILLKRKFNYNIFLFFKNIKFSKKYYNISRKLAYTSIFLTISWILYYELDTFAIAKFFGVNSVAIYAIGLTIITYFRSLFGIIFTPFIAKFNHFVGLNDRDGLKLFFIKVVVLFFPLTVFPVLTIYLSVDNFILSWVGHKYSSSISIAAVLVLTYIFSFITYPSGILVMANERVKALYFTSAIQPIIFWTGILLTKNILGLESFAYFKLLAIFIETIIYTIIVINFLDTNVINLIKQVFLPTILPTSVIIILLYIIKPYLPNSISKANLIYYFVTIGLINLIGIITYYFTSKDFKGYSNNLMTNIFQRFKASKLI